MNNLNKKDSFAAYGVNEFSDLSTEEFHERYLMKNFTSLRTEYETEGKLNELPIVSDMANLRNGNLTSLPASFDWARCVTGIYNQGSCGSCWAFATAENLETMACIAGHGLRNFAMQQLLDCGGSGSCAGGWVTKALPYTISHGIEGYNSYPYLGHQGACRYNAGAVAQRFSRWGYVDKSRNENNIQNWVYSHGAPAVCVDASSWQHYTGGVITSNCGTAINHCVELIGWTTTSGRLAWKVRNSWGAGWGSGGYIYIAIGHNLCAIASEPLTAVV